MGGTAAGVDIDGVYIPGNCSVNGWVEGYLYRYPIVWYGGWHKISARETVTLFTLFC